MSTEKIIRGYRLIRPLKSGGMGSVYVAEKLSTHQHFAVKFMLDHLVEEQSYIVRFEREISALRSIRHPHVVDVFEWSLPESGGAGPPFIVMELLEGEGLDALLKRVQALPPSMAVEITLQILDGLAAAHEVGVVHRDLGPTNVFLEARPGGKFHLKILDFGLARADVGEGGVNVTQEGTLMGKPAYVAPEMFAGGQVDTRSDNFACGVMLYRMLTGRFPYNEANQQMLWVERYADRDNDKEYPSPRTFVPSLPESLDAVVARSIRKRPEDRYQTAREMQTDLLGVEEEIEDGTETVLIQPAAKPEGDSRSTVAGRAAQSLVRRKSRRTRLVATVAAAIVGVGVVATVVILVVGRSGDGANPVSAVEARASDPAGPPGPAVPAEPPSPGGREVQEGGKVHIVVVDAPSGAFVRVGAVALSGDPPHGHVPRAGEPVEMIVAAEGFETYRATVIPDSDKTIRTELKPLVVTTMNFDDPVATASPPERGPGRRDSGATVVRRDGRDAGAGAVRAADAGATNRGGGTEAPDAGRAAPDAGGASRLPPDPFGSSQRLPQDLPF